MRDFLLILHIVAAGTWLGANVTQAVVTRRLTVSGGEVAAAWMRSTVAMARYLYIPAGVLALLTGVGLVLVSEVYEFSDVFVSVGLFTVVVGALLGSRVFGPHGERAAAAFEADDPEAGGAATRRVAGFGMLDTALLLVTITAMVMRWGV